MSDELWLPVKGYEQYYEISNLGRFRRLPKNRILIGCSGLITFSVDNIQKSYNIDELVLRHFGSFEPNVKIHHIDGNLNNHAIDNLTQISLISDLPNEEWRHYHGLHNRYLISTYGRIKNRYIDKLVKPLIESINSVPQISLEDTKGNFINFRVSDLVANVFLGRSNDVPVIQKDGNPLNTHVSNLVCTLEPGSLDGERWVPVNGYEELYMVSSYGRIWSIPRKVSRGSSFVTKGGKFLKPGIDEDGYLRCTLVKNTHEWYVYVHRLVALNFIENKNNLPQINHIDGNKQNNHVDNLEWCTNLMNQKHSIEIGLRANMVRNNHLAIPVKCTDGNEFESIASAARFYDISI